jgi:hypothetical protein
MRGAWSACRLRRPRLVSALTLVVALTAALVLRADLPNQQSSARIAEAQAFLNQVVPDRLPVTAGQVTHLRIELYQRYGPKAAEAMAMPGTGPEHVVQQGWYQFGPDQTLTRWRVTLSDVSGKRVQESVLGQGRLRIVDSKTGAVMRDGPVGPVRANAPAETATRIRAGFREGIAKPVAQTAESLTVEFRERWLELFPSGRTISPDGLAIPYAEDLSPIELITRVAIRNDGILLSEEQHVLTATGEQVLIFSQRMTLHEVLDAAPSGVFEGAPP